MLNPDLLAILRCPLSGGQAELTLEGAELVCPCGVRYPIQDEIPVMLPEEATLPPGCPSPESVACPRRPAGVPA